MARAAAEVRSNTRQRTHAAIVDAARKLVLTGKAVTMPAVAKGALVSEATAYRYFPDLFSLILEALEGTWPEPAEAMESVAGSSDPVERIGHAAEVLMGRVIETEGAARAVISESVIRPKRAVSRPKFNMPLIELALAPLAVPGARFDSAALEELKRELSVVLSADVLFRLTDVCELPVGDAVATAARMAKTLTDAAIRGGQSTRIAASKA